MSGAVAHLGCAVASGSSPKVQAKNPKAELLEQRLVPRPNTTSVPPSFFAAQIPLLVQPWPSSALHLYKAFSSYDMDLTTSLGRRPATSTS